jgi:hypothetical protein
MIDISAPTAVRERYITLWHSQTGGQLPAGIHILKHTILVNNRKRTHPSCRVPHDGFSFFPIDHIDIRSVPAQDKCKKGVQS